MGLRRWWWITFFGVPSGPIGRLGARLMVKSHLFYRAMAAELALQPDDDLLDVGCGSGGLLVEHASHVRHIAGLDASKIQVGMARRRLAERIAAGTAEIVLGDAAVLPWEDGRFSVVTSLNTLKFVPDPEGTLREMCRVLRPGGRAVVTMGENTKPLVGRPVDSGTRDAWGQWQWSDADAARIMEVAGFADVAVSVLPVFSKAKLVRGTRPKMPVVQEASAAAAPRKEAVAQASV
jgi:ubiquinone/menaquinone biosynthesis C-methylase UbiE